MSETSAKVCFDRVLPLEYAHIARDKALNENTENRSQTAFEAAAIRSKLWKPGRTLRISFMDGDPAVQAKVEAAARQWLQFANIAYDFGRHSDADIRISFQQEGSWSAVGTDSLVEEYFPKNEPTMNFGWLRPDTHDSEYYVVLHEFGHALGLIHEHQTPAGGIQWNRPVVIQSVSGPPNNWDLATVEHNIFQRYSATITQFTQFDAHSIMLYSFPKEWTLNGQTFDVNTKLSSTDKAFIAQRYPR